MGADFSGCFAKLRRIEAQLVSFQAAVDAHNTECYGVASDVDNERAQHVQKFTHVDEPPAEFGVIVGEIVNNMRSLLDNVVWQLSIDKGYTPTRDTVFGIKHSNPNGAQFKIKHLDPGHCAYIESLQPYNATDPDRHQLHWVHEINIIDKHRVVHVTEAITRTMQVANVFRSFTSPTGRATVMMTGLTIGQGVTMDATGEIVEVPLPPYAGKVFKRIPFAQVQPQFDTKPVFDVVFGRGSKPVEGFPVMKTLQEIFAYIREHVFNENGPVGDLAL